MLFLYLDDLCTQRAVDHIAERPQHGSQIRVCVSCLQVSWDSSSNRMRRSSILGVFRRCRLGDCGRHCCCDAFELAVHFLGVGAG